MNCRRLILPPRRQGAIVSARPCVAEGPPRRSREQAVRSRGAVMIQAGAQAREHSAAPRLGDPYRPRPLRFIRHETAGDWRLKVYGIATPGKVPRSELVEATVDRAKEVLPKIGPDCPGIGFVIAHDAAS